MNSRFLLAKDVPVDTADWGRMGWISRPQETQSKHITQILVVLEPSVTEAGYELVDVSGQAPWNELRK